MTPPDQAAAQEPSMEEILASIRKIITSDDQKPPEPVAAPEGDVLELTDIAEEVPAPEPEPVEAPVPILASTPDPIAPTPAPELPPRQPDPVPTESLVSAPAQDAAASAFDNLATTLRRETAALEGNVPIGDGNRTLEGMVVGLLRPMLKEWLDANLPLLVERLVQKEIQRIVRKNMD